MKCYSLTYRNPKGDYNNKWNKCCEVQKKKEFTTEEHIWEWASKPSQLPNAYNGEYGNYILSLFFFLIEV